MRTTLNIDNDVFESLQAYSKDRSIALGKAASELMRKGLATRIPTQLVNGVVVFDTPPDSPLITPERVKELESELE